MQIKDLFSQTSKTIPPLDGVRAIAILLVLCIHSKEMLAKVAGEESFLMMLPPFRGGWVGIPLFFTLSGFLIGSQVWEELKSTGDIKFFRFFLKRGFRIWPLFYILYVLFIIFPYRENVTDYLVNAFFLSNFLGDNGPVMASWSLATEEQFYILLPLILKIGMSYAKKRGKGLSFKVIRLCLLILFFIPTVIRYLVWNFYLKMNDFDLATYMIHIYRPITTHSEGLIAGLLLATYFVEKDFPSIKRMHAWLLLAAAFFIGLLSFKSKVYFNFIGVSVAAGTLIWFCLQFKTFLSKFLSLPIFSFIAKCSYSMYLINWPMLYVLERSGLIRSSSLSLNVQLVLNTLFLIIICLLISTFNYIVIEHPFLNLRKKLIKS